MRIVQVSVGSVRMPPKEGSAPLQVIFNTSKHLAKMGHEVAILDRKYSKDDRDVEPIEGVQIARLKALQFPAINRPGFARFILAETNALLFALAVSNYLRKNNSQIDIIHLHLTSIGLAVTLLNRRARGKMIYTCHLGEWGLTGRRLGLFEKIHLLLDPYLMRRISKVIALNDNAKESFVYRGKVKPENIFVVHNGVDTDFFNPAIDVTEVTKKYGLEDKCVVLFVGRLAKIKGVEYLMKAADIVVNRLGYSNALFVLVGPSSFDATEQPISRDKMLDYIEQHQVHRNVLLTGSLSLEEVKMLYAASDIFVLPSLAEGDSLVTIEAMASGKPLIGTRVGGITRQIRDGWNGFLIDPGNERQVADKIKYLIDHPDERKRMGANSSIYAKEEFDWGKVAERLLLAYSHQ